MADRIELDEAQEQALVEAYQASSKSTKLVGKEFGISHNIARRILSKYGALRDNPVKRRYSLNAEFFSSITTEAQAYWLGFLYADGCVTKSKVVEVYLSESDMGHLEKFRQALDSSHPIHVYPNLGSSRNRVAFSVNCQQLYSDLTNLGCLPRKTHCLAFPNEDQVPLELRHHFMRGYFDGDGSIYGHKQRYTTVDGCERIHTSPYFNVTGHRDFLEAYLCHLSVTSTAKIYDEPLGRKAASIKLGGRNLVHSIYQFMYRDAAVFLDRKYYKFRELLRI